MSEKMLAQTLQALEADGFILRKAYPVIPPRVDYSLTVMGREIAEQIEGLAGWIEENLPRVAQSRTNHGKAKRFSG
jgi:DNA-binding HxlR family transcriptional regulator